MAENVWFIENVLFKYFPPKFTLWHLLQKLGGKQSIVILDDKLHILENELFILRIKVVFQDILGVLMCSLAKNP